LTSPGGGIAPTLGADGGTTSTGGGTPLPGTAGADGSTSGAGLTLPGPNAPITPTAPNTPVGGFGPNPGPFPATPFADGGPPVATVLGNPEPQPPAFPSYFNPVFSQGG
jgi:hypothetical protein